MATEDKEESWFEETRKKLEEVYRKNKEARMRELRARGIKVTPDFRTIDEVVDYYAKMQEEQGPGSEEDVETEEAEEEEEEATQEPDFIVPDDEAQWIQATKHP